MCSSSDVHDENMGSRLGAYCRELGAIKVKKLLRVATLPQKYPRTYLDGSIAQNLLNVSGREAKLNASSPNV
jgi:hypothetical protein